MKKVLGVEYLISWLSVIVLSILAFYGGLYIMDGTPDIVIFLNTTIKFVQSKYVVVFLSLFFASLYAYGCFSFSKSLAINKEKRNKKESLLGEICSGVGIVILLVVMFRPVSQFLYVLDHEEDVQRLVLEMKMSVANIDASFNKYVEDRLVGIKDRNVRRSLQRHFYEGFNSIEENKHLTDTIIQERRRWIEGLNEVSVWNVFLPSNVRMLSEVGQKWSDEYAAVSNIKYPQEDYSVQSFKYFESDNKYREYINSYITTSEFSFKNLFMISLLYLGVILTYVMAIRPSNKKSIKRR